MVKSGAMNAPPAPPSSHPSFSDYGDTLVVIVAAGRGARFGGETPKQYRELGGQPVLARTIAAFAAALPAAPIVVAIHPDDRALYDAAIGTVVAPLRPPVDGGATRQDSVRNCIETALDETIKYVLIHDAARPFVSVDLIRAARAAAIAHGAAVPGAPLVDTVIESHDDIVVAALDRASLRAVQTPQAFEANAIRAAHRAAAGLALTDDASVAARAGFLVHVFPGDPDNMKITTAADLAEAERRLLSDLPDIRIGSGFDVHGFEPGECVWLGGVAIPHDRKLEGHSDADVLMHAVTDALLGAIAAGDIGDHFPPSDPQWKGAASALFLAHACALVRARGGMIAHVDSTVVAEAPRIGPHRDAIRSQLAAIMGIDIGRVGLKATTSERLGFTGREEGVVAMATATIRLPAGAP